MTPMTRTADDASLLVELSDPPDGHVPFPPVQTRLDELPFAQLTWQNFERLIYRLASQDASVEHCTRYGRQGQAQHGIDVFARLSNGRYACWQARNVAKYTAAKIKKAVDDFLKGPWADRSDQFTLGVRASLADTKIQNAIEEQAQRLRARSIVFLALDGLPLTDRLRPRPIVIDDFFGRPWVEALLGREAAEALKGRVNASRVIALRQRLGSVYQARFRQLDPGLVRGPQSSAPQDIRARFVCPDVDNANPFAEPSIRPETGTPRSLDRFKNVEWEVEANQVAQPSDLGVVDTQRIVLEDWLMQGRRSVLIGGAGFGKSTVLRCIALELLGPPLVFPRLSASLRHRIPLLIPFAFWSRLTQARQREVGLPELLRDLYGATLPGGELEETMIDALEDERLLLLIDGLDEYADAQAARTTLATIEAFVQSRDIMTIMTGRPAGLRRLGPLAGGDWQMGRLAELSRDQQRVFAKKLLLSEIPRSPDESEERSVDLRVQQFFEQMDQAGRLQSLAEIPLLLHGLVSVAARQALLPRNRFQLFEQLIEHLLEIHPNRRATAAAEVQTRLRAFAQDDQRRPALARLAFEIQSRGADAGLARSEAAAIVEKFLREDDGPGWTREHAKAGGAELTDVNAETSGLIVERSADEIGFCHAAFREHLAGLELARWPLQAQSELARTRGGDPRWRGPLLALLQALTRQEEIEKILTSIQALESDSEDSLERRLLLADAVFAIASRAGSTGRQIATAALDRIEDGVLVEERAELLALALDGPRAGPIGVLIDERLTSWSPGLSVWRPHLYAELGKWTHDPLTVRALWRGMFDDEQVNRLAAATALAAHSAGDESLQLKLITLARTAKEPTLRTAALYALHQGWPNAPDLHNWLDQSSQSVDIGLRTLGLLSRFERGERGDRMRDSLLQLLDDRVFRHSSGFEKQIVDALVSAWGADRSLQDVCWGSLGRQGPVAIDIGYDAARKILLCCADHDPRVGRWVAEEFQSKDHPIVGVHDFGSALGPVLRASPEAREAVEQWFVAERYRKYDYHACQLALEHHTDAAKHALLKMLGDGQTFSFWEISSLLKGWGMTDPETSSLLLPLARARPEEAESIAVFLPEILSDRQECTSRLFAIAALPKVKRPDFLIRGFAAAGYASDDNAVVSAVLPHIPGEWGLVTGLDDLIAHFQRDARVRELALQSLRERSPPLAVMARAYPEDADIRAAILKLAAPLPRPMRRLIAARAAQRPEDHSLRRILNDCDLEEDGHAKTQATIGRSFALTLEGADSASLVEALRDQLHATGPDLEERRAAAFGGLLALQRLDVFARETEAPEGKQLTLDLFGTLRDYTPVHELMADRWAMLEKVLGQSFPERLSRYGRSQTVLWNHMSPYLARSPQMVSRFIQYCTAGDAPISAGALSAFNRLRPRTPELLELCKHILSRPYRDAEMSPLDQARVIGAAAHCIATSFPTDAGALTVLAAAAEVGIGTGMAYVGLCNGWPNHEVVVT